jgi:hypothetical protein
MDSSSDDEADNYDERRNMEGVPTARLPPLIQNDHDARLLSPILTRYRSCARRDGMSPPIETPVKHPQARSPIEMCNDIAT